MEGILKNLIVIIFLGFSLSFLISAVSAGDSTTTSYTHSSTSRYFSYTVKATSDNNVVFFDNSHETVPWTYNTGLGIDAIAISDDGNYVAAGCEGGMVFFFNKNGDILWKRAIENASISSVSISEDNKFIDLTTYTNQDAYITREGRQVDSATRWAGILTPVPTQQIAPETTTAPAVTFPMETNSPIDFGNAIFILVLIAPVALVVFWAVMKRHQKTHAAMTPPPPRQKGTIAAASVPEGAAIYLNGVYRGDSPVEIRNLSFGLYSLKATLKGYTPDTQQITVTSGQSVWLYTPALRKIPGPRSPSQPDAARGKQETKIIFQKTRKCGNCNTSFQKEDLIQCGPCGNYFCPDCWEEHQWSHGKAPATGIKYHINGTKSGFNGSEQ